MTEARWQSVKSLFLEAVALSDDEREAFLRDMIVADEEVSAQVRALLAESVDSGPDLRQACWGPPPGEREAAPAYTFQIGERLTGRFEVVGFLGAGGLGEVYRAFDHHKRMFVAIKTLRPGMVADPLALAILRNELNTAQAVTHPNVCRVFDIHFPTADNASTFFTMELLEGETLASHLRRQGRFQPERASELIPQILDGLDAIHGKGIVHRDFKANNIMLTDDGTRAVVMDFGLARELKSSTDLATTLASSEFAGTPAYMAPEQLRGQPATFSTDIHALGVVLFEMMTAHRPFEGATPMESAAKRLNERAPSPRRLVSTLDKRWEYMILQCLEAEPARRPSSVDAVRTLLTGSRPGQLRSRRVLLMGGVAAAAAAFGATILRPMKRSGMGGLRLGVSDFVNRTGDARFDGLARETTAELVRLLSQDPGLNVVRSSVADRSPTHARMLTLEGGFARNNEDLSWDLRLVDQESRRTIWSRSFAQKPGQEVGVLHGQLARNITLQLSQMQELSGSPVSKGLALDAYTRGRALLGDASPTHITAAIELLKQAVELDPQFALAWSALADGYLAQTAYVTGGANQLLKAAKESANRAVSIDHTLPEGHAALGAIRQQELDWEGSEQSYQEALRQKPFFPRLHRWYAGFALQFGWFDKVQEHSRIALEQDPYDQMNPMAVGFYLLFSGKVQEAIDLMEPFVEGRNLEATRYNLGQAYARMAQKTSYGREREAWLKKAFGQAEIMTGVEQREKIERPLMSDKLYALVHTIAGHKTEAKRYVEKLREDMDRRTLTPADVAWTYAIEGDSSTALDLLERAYGESPSGLVYIKVNPFLENLRKQPRFERLIRDLRL